MNSPARALPHRESLPPGARLGDFAIVRTLGSGGFGTVYLARDSTLDRTVAIKEFLPVQIAYRAEGQQVAVRSPELAAHYAAGLRSFVNEARILARFNHPAIVKVHRFWEANGTAYMVMPYVRGPTLREVRRSMDAAPGEAWLRSVLDPLLDALAMLHAEGIQHRDIAPDNILLPRPNEPVLLDFGAARRVIGDRTQTFTAVLKPSFAPIEQYGEANQLRQGPWTDLYALGAVVVYLLNTTPPPPSTVRVVHDEMPPLTAQPRPGVSTTFLAAVQWALAVRPQHRPQTVQQFRDALDGRITPPLPLRTAGASPASDDTAERPLPIASNDERAWTDTAMTFTRHEDVRAADRPQAATWDTTIRLGNTAPQTRAFGRAAAERVPPPARTALIVAFGAAAVFASGLWALMREQAAQPGAATWRELAEVAAGAEAPAPPIVKPAAAARPPSGTGGNADAPVLLHTVVTTPMDPTAAVAPEPAAKLIAETVPSKPPAKRSASRKPVRTPSKPASVRLDPRTLCGDRNIFSMAICVNRKCEEPKFQAHPRCVALERQRQEWHRTAERH